MGKYSGQPSSSSKVSRGTGERFTFYGTIGWMDKKGKSKGRALDFSQPFFDSSH